MILKEIARNARENSQRIAITAFDEQITFGELEKRSSELAQDMSARNDDEILAFDDGGSVDHFVKMLACLKSARAFVNLDAKAPPNFNRRILERLKDAPRSETAYFVATSGTTGEPKLIARTCRTLARSLEQFRQALPELIGRTIQQAAPLHYAFGLDQSIVLLSAGSTICIDAPDENLNLLRQYERIARHEAEVIFWAAPILKLLSKQPQLFCGMPKCLKCIVSGGEPLSVSAAFLFELRNRELLLLNNYGCTETGTLFFSRTDIPLLEIQEYNRLPIGRPLPGFEAELDEVGRLIVTIDGVRFQTNDLAEYSRGQFYIAGRADNCVNVRGYRVSLEFVENYIRRLNSIDECCVVPSKNAFDEISLTCFWQGERIDPIQFRTELAELLPEYMIPTRFFYASRLPRLPNGKLDRQTMLRTASDFSRAPNANASSFEIRIKNLLEDVLKKELPPDFQRRTFAELGLDSLSFTDFICRVESEERITIDDAMIIDRRLQNVGDLLDCIGRRE